MPPVLFIGVKVIVNLIIEFFPQYNICCTIFADKSKLLEKCRWQLGNQFVSFTCINTNKFFISVLTNLPFFKFHTCVIEKWKIQNIRATTVFGDARERQIEVILFRGLFRKFPTQVTISAWSESGFYLNFPFCSFIQHNKQEIETQIQGRTKHAEEVNLFWGNLSKQLFFQKARKVRRTWMLSSWKINVKETKRTYYLVTTMNINEFIFRFCKSGVLYDVVMTEDELRTYIFWRLFMIYKCGRRSFKDRG